MNERIRELIEQATEPPAFPGDIGCFNREKFAELVVRECAGLDFRHKVGMTVQQDYDTSCVILQHFGLKL